MGLTLNELYSSGYSSQPGEVIQFLLKYVSNKRTTAKFFYENSFMAKERGKISLDRDMSLVHMPICLAT